MNHLTSAQSRHDQFQGMAEYSDDMIYPLLWEYTRVAPFATYSEVAARVRNCIVAMIFEYCRMRDDLPNPDEELAYADMGNGRIPANAVHRFIILVHCTLEEMNDPDRPIPFEETWSSIYDR